MAISTKIERFTESQHLHSLLMQVPAMVAICLGPEFVYELANPLFLKVVGKDESIIGKPLLEIFPELIGQGIFEILTEVYTSGEPFIGDELLIKLDTDNNGKLNDVYFNFIYQAVRNPNGEIEGVMTHAVEVTAQVMARKKAEQLAEEMDAQAKAFDNILAALEDHVYTFDSNGRLLYANAALLKMLGRNLADIKGKKLSELNYEEQLAEKLLKQIEWVTATGKSIKDETIHTYINGVTGCFEYIFMPVTNDEGKVISVAGSTRDITIRKAIEEKAQDTAESLRFMADTMPQMVWTAKPDGNIDYFNKRWYDYTGTTSEQSKNSGWQSVLHPDDLEKSNKLWAESVQTGKPFETEYRFKRASDNKYRWFLGRAFAMGDPNGKDLKWFGTCTDIDDHKNLLHELNLIKQELEKRVAERTNNLNQAMLELKENQNELIVKNNELEQFAFVASHDLKEPLRMISSYSDMVLKLVPKDNPDTIVFSNFIKEGVTRMDALITDLLNYSRINPNKDDFQSVDCNQIMSEVMESLHLKIEETGTQIIAQDLPVIKGVATYVHRLFQNLLENSIKFRREGVAPVINVSASVIANNLWQFKIQDNGIGIEPQYAERIFVIFQRLHTREKYEGTGIGLSVCKKIVEIHGGRIWPSFKSENGSCFNFTMPKAE